MSRKRPSLGGDFPGDEKRQRDLRAADPEESQSSDRASAESRAPASMMEIDDEAAQSSSSAAPGSSSAVPRSSSAAEEVIPAMLASPLHENGYNSSGNRSPEGAAQNQPVETARVISSQEDLRADVREDPCGDNSYTHLSSSSGSSSEEKKPIAKTQPSVDSGTAVSHSTGISADAESASQQLCAQMRRTSFSGCLQAIKEGECSKTAYPSEGECSKTADLSEGDSMAEKSSESGENVAEGEHDSVSTVEMVERDVEGSTELPGESSGPSGSSEGASSARRTKRPSDSQDDPDYSVDAGHSESEKRRSEGDDNVP